MSLEIVERQVLVYFEDDPIVWHHRVLMQQIEGPKWIVLTPDYELETFDLSSVAIGALAPGAAFPRNIGQIYGFDNPPDAAELAAARVEAERMASILGVATTTPARAAVGGTWRYADTGYLGFAEEVAPEVLAVLAKVEVKGSSALINVATEADPE